MNVLKFKGIFLTLSGLLVLASIGTLITNGLQFSIEFTGGSLMEVEYTERPQMDAIDTALAEAGFPDALSQPTGEQGLIIRAQNLTETQRQELVTALTIDEQTPEEKQFTSIGPSIGQELRQKALIALIIVLVAIVLFVAFAFRKVSKPVSSWRYGIIAVIALFHDVIIPIGVFSLMERTISPLFVVGLLSILGLSVNDTIVVFDRIRENLSRNMKDKLKLGFTEIVGRSIKQTVTRSINTSLTLIVVLVALFIWGPIATQDLALVLLIGTLLGTYSSIFLASPLLVVMQPKKVEVVTPEREA